jgi:hypothetical protein
MKRECSTEILKAMKAYDPDLSLLWNERSPRWDIAWRGEPLFAYMREGKVVQEPLLDEVMRIVRQSDDRDRLDYWRGEFRKCRNIRIERERREKEAYLADARKETANIADFYRRGKKAKPFIPPNLTASLA